MVQPAYALKPLHLSDKFTHTQWVLNPQSYSPPSIYHQPKIRKNESQFIITKCGITKKKKKKLHQDSKTITKAAQKFIITVEYHWLQPNVQQPIMHITKYKTKQNPS